MQADPACDRIGNVVEFEIQKDGCARRRDSLVTFPAEGIEKLQPDLQSPDFRGQRDGQLFGFRAVICVQPGENGIFEMRLRHPERFQKKCDRPTSNRETKSVWAGLYHDVREMKSPRCFYV